MKRFFGTHHGPIDTVYCEDEPGKVRYLGSFDWGPEAKTIPYLANVLARECFGLHFPCVVNGVGVFSFFVYDVIRKLPDEWSLTESEIKNFFFKHAVLSSGGNPEDMADSSFSVRIVVDHRPNPVAPVEPS